MGKRGAALPTVLALISVVLVAGLAMGSLSTLSLQFSRRQLDVTRSEMAARSGLAYFLARVQAFEAEDEQEVNPLDPKPLPMTDIFPEGLHLDEGEYKVSIIFVDKSVLQKEKVSSDNLAGEEPKMGSFDQDGVPRIPPFGLDLVIKVEGPRQTQHYRAVLKRFWPFAIYTKHGALTLMGQPELKQPDSLNRPTRVVGDVYTGWQVNDDDGQAVNFEGRVKGYGLGEITDPAKLLANLEARTGYQPWRVPYHPLILGMQGHLNYPPEAKGMEEIKKDGEVRERFYSYDPSSWVYEQWPRKWEENEFARVEFDLFFPPPEGHEPSNFFCDVGSVLNGDLYYNHQMEMVIKEMAVEPSVPGAYPPPGWESPLNRLNGEIHLRRPPTRDPLAALKGDVTIDTSKFKQVKLDFESEEALEEYARAIPGLEGAYFEYNDDSPKRNYFLQETLTLTEDTKGSQFVIYGSVSNRQSIYHKETETLFIRERRAGLDLQGVTLVVKGDMDLGATSFYDKDNDGNGIIDSDDAIQISGAGATLIVEGQLSLGNAHINAGDQAFVIYAQDIVLKGGGTFHGLLVASRSITVLSQDDEPLEIVGGIACADRDHGGGIIIRGADITHEPRYLKAINGAGDFYLSSWRKL